MSKVIDKEWMELMVEAKQAGISKEEIQSFLNSNGFKLNELNLVMVNGKRILLEKGRRTAAEKWVQNCIEFVEENDFYVGLEDTKGNSIYSKRSA